MTRFQPCSSSSPQGWGRDLSLSLCNGPGASGLMRQGLRVPTRCQLDCTSRVLPCRHSCTSHLAATSTCVHTLLTAQRSCYPHPSCSPTWLGAWQPARSGAQQLSMVQAQRLHAHGCSPAEQPCGCSPASEGFTRQTPRPCRWPPRQWWPAGTFWPRAARASSFAHVPASAAPPTVTPSPAPQPRLWAAGAGCMQGAARLAGTQALGAVQNWTRHTCRVAVLFDQGTEPSKPWPTPARQRPAVVSHTGRLWGQQCSWSSQQTAFTRGQHAQDRQ